LKAEERERREKEGISLYFGGKHELNTCAKRIARETAKLAKK